jgi:hypothetical protein
METRVFLLFFLGLSLLMVGGSGYVVTFDQDYRVTALNTKADSGVAYDSLSPERQQSIDAAFDNTHIIVDDESAVPPSSVAVSGQVYGFKSVPVTDYDEPGHPLHYPFLVAAVLGLVMTVESLRRNHAPYWKPWQRVVPSSDE